MASPTFWPAATWVASFASHTIATVATSGLGSSGAALSSVNAQAPCPAPSTITWPRSFAARPLRASVATANASCVAPNTRARFAATAAARRMLERVTSPLFPTPTSRMRRALPRFEYREPVAHVATGRHAEPADLCDAGVGEVVTVEIRRGDHGVFFRAQQHLLEHRVRDAVLDHHLSLFPFPLSRL